MSEVDYESLYDNIEKIIEIEKLNKEAKLKGESLDEEISRDYGFAINSLPEIISSNDLIDYHYFLLQTKNDIIDDKILDEKKELIKTFKNSLLERLESACSLKAYQKIRDLVEEVYNNLDSELE